MKNPGIRLTATLLLFAVCMAGVKSFGLANNRNSSKARSLPKLLSTTKNEQETDDMTAKVEPKQKEFEVKTRNPLRLLVLKLGLTEPAMTSPFNYGKYDGKFNCAYCGQTLFDSDAKYDSGSGWPSFWRSANEDSIAYKMEFDGRLECRCKRCSSHLGHVFMDGPRPGSVPKEVLDGSPESDPRTRADTYLPRFCINGAAMTFEEREKSSDSNA